MEPDGKVNIKCLSTTVEKTVQMESLLFEMQTQNICPPGFFIFLLQLPVPVDLQGFFCDLTNGALEGIVTKRQARQWVDVLMCSQRTSFPNITDNSSFFYKCHFIVLELPVYCFLAFPCELFVFHRYHNLIFLRV